MKTVGDVIYSESEVSSLMYVINWAVLLVLLLVTWRLAYTHLGDLTLIFAMTIAVIKCSFVVWYYMDLRSSPKLVLMLFGMALVMLFIAALLTMADYVTRGELEGDRNTLAQSKDVPSTFRYQKVPKGTRHLDYFSWCKLNQLPEGSRISASSP